MTYVNCAFTTGYTTCADAHILPPNEACVNTLFAMTSKTLPTTNPDPARWIPETNVSDLVRPPAPVNR